MYEPLVCRSTWSRYRPSSGRLRCENTSSASGDFSASPFTGIFIWREAIRFSFVGDGPYLGVPGRQLRDEHTELLIPEPTQLTHLRLQRTFRHRDLTVCSWPKADMATGSSNVRFWGQSGHDADLCDVRPSAARRNAARHTRPDHRSGFEGCGTEAQLVVRPRAGLYRER